MVKFRQNRQKPGNILARGSNRQISRLFVTRAAQIAPQAHPIGRLRAGSTALLCAIGAAGIRHRKLEGDRATPAGRFACLCVYFKAGAGQRPRALMRFQSIRADLGWCDDWRAATYNRPVRLPSRFGHEKMHREDGLYDLVIVIDYNYRRRVKNRGSAIFLHCARPDLAPTAGCVALRPLDWRRLLPRLARQVTIVIGK